MRQPGIGAGLRLFQFTPARGGRPNISECFIPLTSFNSRPRVAGDPVGVLCLCAAQRVSIHARAWRATVAASASFAVLVFQFTPARGGRRASASRTNKHWSFNSRPRVAGDIHPPTNPLGKQVSIHARAWRATSALHEFSNVSRFQFTPARGGRRWAGVVVLILEWFQFTPARGGRLGHFPRFRPFRCFNSRPRVAGDMGGEHVSLNQDVSIHARAWRATRHAQRRVRHLVVSIHARAWRATRPCRQLVQRRVVSIHARAWRATARRWYRLRASSSFNSRPRVAGDHMRGEKRLYPFCFNSRPRVAGDHGGSSMDVHNKSFNSRPRVAGDVLKGFLV